MNAKLRLPSCMSMGGVSPVTGKKVWNRHSWPGPWGHGQCRFCGYSLTDLQAEARRRAEQK